ncbi:hypothetical protein HerbRD11066_60510 [Herbidospora sp. RD11066]
MRWIPERDCFDLMRALHLLGIVGQDCPEPLVGGHRPQGQVLSALPAVEVEDVSDLVEILDEISDGYGDGGGDVLVEQQPQAAVPVCGR